MSAEGLSLRHFAIPGWVPLFLGMLLTVPAVAHQQKESITRILFNERTGNIEVMHRFLLHDAEHATRRLFGKKADLLGKPEDCERFEDYVHKQFILLDQRGEPLGLQSIGNEIDGEFLWVYAEATIPEGLTALTLSQQALREIWPEQTNLVNVERFGTVKSAVFGPGSEEVTIELTGLGSL
ncbi:MAG: DUF6702 family protein [Pseudomonadota bacterium]